MKLLKEITESDVGVGPLLEEKGGVRYMIRKAARAVVFDDAGRIALLHAENDNYHKLPGGGIEEGEDVLEALSRELREELGVEGTVIRQLGVTIEYRARHELLQLSYGYSVQVTGKTGEPSLTKEEQAAGLTVKWVEPDDAIAICERDEPDRYVGRFIQYRDLVFLRQQLGAAD